MASSELFEAIAADEVGRVRELVEADPSIAGSRGPDGVSAILSAQYRRSSEIVDVLREAQPGLDVFDASALGANDELAEMLDGNAALAQAWSSDGFSALHLAAYFGHPDTVGLLLGTGADATATAHRPDAVEPLHSGAAGRSADVVRRLIAAGADPNARQLGGWTPLHAAAMNGDDDIVEMLLAAGADPSLANDQGTLPLDLANKGDHKEVIERLSAEV